MRYKLFMLDVGLLGALSELPATSILEGNDIFIEFKGALTEQYMLQQMISDTPHTPYYYGTESYVFDSKVYGSGMDGKYTIVCGM